MKNFPSDSGIVFLVCDDFRQEAGGKSTLLGVYGDTVVIEGATQDVSDGEIAIPSLAFYIAFSDGDGEFAVSFELFGPNMRSLLPSGAKQTVVKKPEGWMTLAFKMMPFPAQEGTYSLNILLDEKKYVRNFYVQRPLSSSK